MWIGVLVDSFITLGITERIGPYLMNVLLVGKKTLLYSTAVIVRKSKEKIIAIKKPILVKYTISRSPFISFYKDK